MKAIISELQAKADACYARGEYHRNPAGQILNELGKPAKGRDIILRAVNGYPLVRFLDLNTRSE